MNINNLFSFVSTLTGVQRFSMLKAVHQENVLEHTGMVAVFGLAIADTLNKCEPRLDMERLLRILIIHDFDEAVTGDVARPTKYFSAELRAEMAKFEAVAIAQIAAKLDMDLSLYPTAKLGTEGFVLRVADLMAMVHRVWEEVAVYGNKHFLQPISKLLDLIDELRGQVPGYFNGGQAQALAHILMDMRRKLEDINDPAPPMTGFM